MKAKLPLVICAVVFLYSAWMLHFGPGPGPHLDTEGTVEVTVRGPDGKIIPPIRRAH